MMPSCLFVCLCAGYLKTWSADLKGTRWTVWVCEKDKMIRFWWRSRSESVNKNWVIPHHWEIEPKIMFSITWYFKKLWIDLDETWWTGWVWDKDELIRSWWRSRSRFEKFFVIFLYHGDIWPKTIWSTISQKVMDGLVRNLVDEFGRWQEQAN